MALMWYVFTHTFALVLYNRSRRQTLLRYVDQASGKELTERQATELQESYTGPFGHVGPYPDKQRYAGLYTNEAFSTWSHRSKRLLLYLLGGVAGGYVALAISTLFE